MRVVPWIVLALIIFTGCSGESISSEPSIGSREAVSPAPTGTPLPTPVVHVEPALSTESQLSTASTTPENVTGKLNPQLSSEFDGENAYSYLLDQMAFGPRWPGSPGHAAVGDFIIEELTALGWQVEEQKFEHQGIDGRNIIGKANQGSAPLIILGAHYDSRKIADKTPGSTEPVPGAVDGASGVAALLELARSLDLDQIDREIWLAFFDMEDQGSGGMEGFDWIIGSSYMASNLTKITEAMVLLDMIGDADQQIYYEGNSTPILQYKLWRIAADLGFGQVFIPKLRFTMTDDHVPFAQKGIAAAVLIDYDFPYHHTVEDTADKASPESLYRVGRTIEVWLEDRLEG